MNHRHWNLGLGLFFGATSIVTLFWWIPNDVETGVLVQDRYSIEIGDAMAPTAIAIGILIISIILVVTSIALRATISKDKVEAATALTKSNLANILVLALIMFVSMALTVWGGTLTVSALNGLGLETKPYRLLTDTVPYKYVGFAAGGFVMVMSLISWVEGRPSLRACLIAFGAVVAIILVYDIPFDNLLLPPNGNQ